MTKLQKRVYSLILRALIILLYWRVHDPNADVVAKTTGLRKEITNAIVELEGK